MDVEENEQVGYGNASNNFNAVNVTEPLPGHKEFSRLCTKSKHEQRCRKVDYNCSDCSRVFTSIKELKIHHQSSHKPLIVPDGIGFYLC